MDMQQLFNTVFGVLMAILSFIGKSVHNKLNTLEDKTFNYHSEFSNYRTHVASTYMTVATANDNNREIKDRLIRIEQKLDQITTQMGRGNY